MELTALYPQDELVDVDPLGALLREEPHSVIEQERLMDVELAAFRRLFMREAASSAADVRVLLNDIHAHLFDESLSVGWILQYRRVWEADIHTRFRHELHMTIRDYIEDRRMMAAMWLLWWDELDIFSVSYRLGYNNYRTFARAFKRYVGCSPSAYRARMSRCGLAAQLQERLK